MEAMTKDEKEGIAKAAVDSEKYFDNICWGSMEWNWISESGSRC